MVHRKGLIHLALVNTVSHTYMYPSAPGSHVLSVNTRAPGYTDGDLVVWVEHTDEKSCVSPEVPCEWLVTCRDGCKSLWAGGGHARGALPDVAQEGPMWGRLLFSHALHFMKKI